MALDGLNSVGPKLSEQLVTREITNSQPTINVRPAAGSLGTGSSPDCSRIGVTQQVNDPVHSFNSTIEKPPVSTGKREFPNAAIAEAGIVS